MYEDHFGLNDRPFGETLGLERFVSLPSREAALRRLRYGLEQVQGPALLFGTPGTGKTLLARVLAHELNGVCAHLVFPAMPAAELVAYLADELADQCGGESKSEGASGLGASVRRLSMMASASALRGDRPLLIIDEAHLIEDPATFETLRLLLNLSTAGSPDLSLLLVGAPEVLLRLPTALADRLSARCLLAPLTESESAAYIEGRLESVAAPRGLFAPDALIALHRAAEGLPRRLNRLADLTLLIAYGQSRSHVDAALVAIAAREACFEPFAA